jgi:hypothetical protein
VSTSFCRKSLQVHDYYQLHGSLKSIDYLVFFQYGSKTCSADLSQVGGETRNILLYRIFFGSMYSSTFPGDFISCQYVFDAYQVHFFSADLYQMLWWFGK